MLKALGPPKLPSLENKMPIKLLHSLFSCSIIISLSRRETGIVFTSLFLTGLVNYCQTVRVYKHQ